MLTTNTIFKETRKHLEAKFPTKSDRARYLAETYGHDRAGHNLCAPISRHLDMRYQSVRNVLVEWEGKRRREGKHPGEAEFEVRIPAVLLKRLEGVEKGLGMKRGHIVTEALSDKINDLEHLASVMHRIKDGKKRYSLEEVEAMLDD